MRTSWLRASILAFTGLALACGGGTNTGSEDSGPDGNGNVVVETAVDSTTADVGADVTVTCTVTQDGQPVQAATEIVVGGTTKFVVEGDKVTFDEAGEFTVACKALGVVDDTPETVAVGGARAKSIETAIDPDEIVAGGQTTVTCTAVDAEGKPVAVSATLDVNPPAGTSVAPGATAGVFTLTANKAGQVSVACRTIDGSLTDATPEMLKITAGPVAKVLTTVTPDSIPAGGQADVVCAAQDAQGNTVQIAFTITATPDGLTATVIGAGGSVTGTKAALYDVKCAPKDGSAATLEGDSLTVTALEPVGLLLSLVPAQKSYSVASQVKVSYSLADKYGNPVPGAGAIQPITVTPVEGITKLSEDSFQFDAEGRFTFRSCLVDAPETCDDVEGVCDGTAPTLAITYPERGATLNGNRVVTVTGVVSDAVSQVNTLQINGTPVTVALDGSFQFPITSSQGMNLIDATVVDEFDNEVRTIRSYLFSYEWYPMDPAVPTASMAPNGVMAYVDDLLFYNPDPTDAGTLSAVLTTTLAGMDLMTLIPNPLTQIDQLGCKYDIFLTGAKYSKPAVQLQTVQGGVGLNAVLNSLVIDILLKKTGGGFLCPGDTGAHATADKVTISTVITIAVDPTTHVMKMTAGTTNIALDNFDLTVDAWFNFLIGLFKGTIENVLKDEFTKQVASLVDSLNETLGQYLGTPIELPIDAPLPGMNNLVLRIPLQPQTAAFDTNGGEVDLNVNISSDKLVDRTILGSIGRASCLSETPEKFTLKQTDNEKIQLGAFDDVLNQALYAVWNNRFLHMHITSAGLAEAGIDTSSIPVTNLDVVTAPLIPPVITACPTEPFKVQLGDFYTEASFDFGGPVVLHMYLFLEMNAELKIVDDPEKGRQIGIALSEPHLVEIETVFINEEWEGQEYVFEDLIKGALPLVFDSLKDKPIAFSLPSINLAGLGGEGGTLPLPNKDLVIDVKELGHDLGYTHLAAGLLIQDPPVEPPPAP